ncbi:hypothetical protein LOTGIDRAFT_157694 [Lottia gigantea]|uniref:EF-hand domain-containing protein n=1 Tax=Lottia gigantea TaxID=225164 RepID=V4B2D8_LOTGI|nr:hypothetical protein LOTGIDRAFT_157694 [Lottia gigantea]ESP00487.1 hypothetical protein LOTGIDRAFT_157694 [Lottia gigantea]
MMIFHQRKSVQPTTVVLVAAVLVVNVEGWGWRAPRIRIPPISIPRIRIPSIPAIPRIPWGKRNVRQAEGDAAFNAAAEDGVLSDDEIKSLLGVAHENLTEVYEVYDVNDNGVITVAEFEAVSSILANNEGQ